MTARRAAGEPPFFGARLDITYSLTAEPVFRWNKRAMTKADLIEEVSRLAELTRKDSEIIVETIFDSVVRSLRAGDKIEIRGFDSFRTRQRKPRVGRNPKTGARVEVPAKKIPYFKPSKELKDVINHGEAAAAASGPAGPGTTPAPETH